MRKVLIGGWSDVIRPFKTLPFRDAEVIEMAVISILPIIDVDSSGRRVGGIVRRL